MDHTTTTYTIPTTATTTNTTYVTSIPYANLHTDIHARTNMWAPLDTPSPREGRVWVDMCNKLLECFKEHFRGYHENPYLLCSGCERYFDRVREKKHS